MGNSCFVRGTKLTVALRMPSCALACLYGAAAVVLLAQVGSLAAWAAGEPTMGPFEGHADVGEVKRTGEATYDSRQQTYTIAGAGSNMWFGKDEYHWVWKRVRGDFILRTDAQFLGEGVEAHRKLGWMARATTAADSPHVTAVVHGDGLTSLQFRRSQGSDTEEVKSALSGADVIQLERQGSRYTMSVARFGQPLTSVHVSDLDLDDELIVGLFVCSHNADVLEKARFRNVRIIKPAKRDFVPYRDYIGSRLETLNIETGERKMLGFWPGSIQCTNWTPDGTALIYNGDGRLHRFDLASRHIDTLDTGFATRNNNDHVLSFDGTQIGISHHNDDDGGKSIIYTLPAGGGTPQRVTRAGPSYLHGWSPDGKHLLYTGERNGEFDIYRIDASGGVEEQLTSAPGLDDGSEYSPDGRFIYFCSNRTGVMQVWRMRPDGGQQEQITHDDFNNWFPHISPDGRWIVFLSFNKEIDSDDHPFYKQVYLRMMSAEGGEPKVIAYVYGGQGTINVPSWSPDSKHIAFVSNSHDH